ncbi:MAG: hypothetical protein LBV74_03555, partial [Tannerella sp.]|nr:hypothetical protein [Tannerella sp.]
VIIFVVASDSVLQTDLYFKRLRDAGLRHKARRGKLLYFDIKQDMLSGAGSATYARTDTNCPGRALKDKCRLGFLEERYVK